MEKTLLLIIPLFFLFLSCEEKETSTPDTTPPTVTITFSTQGSVSEVVSITCMSSDNEGVEKVELWVNGVSTGVTDNTEPYSLDWNTTTYDDGSHTIVVRSYDTSGNTTDSDPITLIVDNSVSYPQSISISSIVFGDGSFTITWNQSTDGDFNSYNLEKSIESTMGDYNVVYTSVNVTDITYVDTDVDPLSYQYYRITVIDTFSYETKGQIVSSSLDPLPTSIDVSSVTYTFSEMTVEWGESIDGDFRYYKLLYSETESGGRDTLETYTDKSITSYIITDFDPLHENWFWVLVSDTLGQSSVGSGITNIIDSPPTQVEINPIVYENGSFIITWSQNNDDDFQSYTLYESTSEDMSGQIETFVVENRESLEYEDINISYDIQKFYRLVVSDIWGLNTQSSIRLGSSYQKIVYGKYTNNSNHLFVIDSGPYNEGPIQLLYVRSDIPLWFPDGTKVLFHYNNQGTGTLKPDGTDLIIHPYEGQTWGYNISSDGNLVILWNNSYDICKINPDGTNLTQLSPDDDYHYSSSDFSPDGSEIVFSKRGDLYDTGQTDYEIWTMDINGGNLTRLTSPEPGTHISNPKWSPNGNEILFSKDGNLWIMNSDGSNSHELGSPYGGNSQWSPDGNTILINTSNPSYLYTIERDGSNLTNIGEGRNSSWSPDGSKIILQDDNVNITIVNLDGSNPIIITEGENPKLQPRP